MNCLDFGDIYLMFKVRDLMNVVKLPLCTMSTEGIRRFVIKHARTHTRTHTHYWKLEKKDLILVTWLCIEENWLICPIIPEEMDGL